MEADMKTNLTLSDLLQMTEDSGPDELSQAGPSQERDSPCDTTAAMNTELNIHVSSKLWSSTTKDPVDQTQRWS